MGDVISDENRDQRTSKFMCKIVIFYLCLIISLTLGNIQNGFSQTATEDEEFNNLGSIAYSNDYKLSPESDHITYRIKNQTSLTLDKVYVWIYHEAEDEEGKTLNPTLVNNPHRGGVITLGKPHRPGDIAEWRFPLIKKLTSKLKGGKYTLRVSSKGIFHLRVEPPPVKSEE